MAEQNGNKWEINLGKDFGDVVIIAGDARIEIHNTKPPQAFTAAANDRDATPVITPESNKGGKSIDRIVKAAEAAAREYRHPAVTFNHLLLALTQDGPEDLDKVVGPQLRAAGLQRMLRQDLQRLPSTETGGTPAPLTRLAYNTLMKAHVSTSESYNSDRLFGMELLKAMLGAPKPDKPDRSTTLDYIALMLSRHASVDAKEECRKKVAALALELGERRPDKPKLLVKRPSTAVTYNPEL